MLTCIFATPGTNLFVYHNRLTPLNVDNVTIAHMILCVHIYLYPFRGSALDRKFYGPGFKNCSGSVMIYVLTFSVTVSDLI